MTFAEFHAGQDTKRSAAASHIQDQLDGFGALDTRTQNQRRTDDAYKALGRGITQDIRQRGEEEQDHLVYLMMQGEKAQSPTGEIGAMASASDGIKELVHSLHGKMS